MNDNHWQAGRQAGRQAELDNITFLKCILMLTVVAGHSMAFWNGTWFTCDPQRFAPILGILSQWTGSFHTYAFMLVSGYLYAYVRYERENALLFPTFFKSKVKRLLVPFVFVLAIWVIPITSVFFHLSTKHIVLDMILAAAPGQLWFLWMLFDVYILFWPMSDFLKKHTWPGVLLVLVCYGIGTVGGIAAPNIFQIWTAMQYAVFFWMGFQLRTNGSGFIMRIHPLIWIAFDLLLFLARCLIPKAGILFKVGALAAEFLLHIVGACMAFVVLQAIGSRLKWKSSTVFQFLSKRSMPIYLFHQQVIYLTIFLFNGKINPYIHSVLNFVISLGVSLIVSSVFLNFRTTRFLIGEKA